MHKQAWVTDRLLGCWYIFGGFADGNYQAIA